MSYDLLLQTELAASTPDCRSVIKQTGNCKCLAAQDDAHRLCAPCVGVGPVLSVRE